MAEEIFVLSANDRRLIQEWLDQRRRGIVNTTNRAAVDWVEHQAPEVYIIRTPDTGISALTEDTDVTPTTYHPGYADCDVYRVVEDSGVPRLEEVSGFFKRVFNFNACEVSASKWALISREKYGYWTIAEVFDCEETDTGTGTGTGTDTGTDATGTDTTGTGTSECALIPGVDFATLPIATDPDYILGIKDGCLVKVPVSNCNGTGT